MLSLNPTHKISRRCTWKLKLYSSNSESEAPCEGNFALNIYKKQNPDWRKNEFSQLYIHITITLLFNYIKFTFLFLV